MSTSSHTTRSTSPAKGSSRINVGQLERVASALGGGLLAAWGLRRFSLPRLLTAATGGVLLYRGLTGHCPGYEQMGVSTAETGRATALEIDEAVTVNKPREEVYDFWRELENLPRFMRHIESVEALDEKRSRWTARVPKVPKDVGTISWEAEITEDAPNERIAWRSLARADIQNAGTVRFKDAPEGRGTEVHAQIRYRPPAGDVGALVTRLLDPANEQMVREDVRRFKHILEAGEAPKIEGQPTGKGRA